MTIDAVLFDNDGTLIDFDATFEPATKLVLEDLATNDMPLADLATSVGFDLNSQSILPGSVLIAGSLYDIVDHIAELVEVPNRGAFFHRIDRLYREASLETFFFIRRPRCYILFPSTTLFRSHLEALGWTRYFDFIAGCDSGFGAKPEAGMVTAFCNAMNVQATNTVMVGDSAHDCSAGNAAGAKTDAIEQMADVTGWPVQPDRTISAIEELPAMLRAMSA